MAYGDVNEKEIEFRLFRSETEETITFSKTVAFDYNSIAGSIDSPVILNVENATQTSIHNSQFIIHNSNVSL